MVIEKTYREEWSQDLTVPCKSVMILGEFHKKMLVLWYKHSQIDDRKSKQQIL